MSHYTLSSVWACTVAHIQVCCLWCVIYCVRSVCILFVGGVLRVCLWHVWYKERVTVQQLITGSYVRCFSQSACQERCKVLREFQDMFRGGKALPSDLTQAWQQRTTRTHSGAAREVQAAFLHSLVYERTNPIVTSKSGLYTIGNDWYRIKF